MTTPPEKTQGPRSLRAGTRKVDPAAQLERLDPGHPVVKERAWMLIEEGVCLDMTSALELACNPANWPNEDPRDGTL